MRPPQKKSLNGEDLDISYFMKKDYFGHFTGHAINPYGDKSNSL
jgi:hypothetical protein